MLTSQFGFWGAALRTLLVMAALGGGTTPIPARSEPIWPTQQWQTSTPEGQGMDSAALAKLIEFGTSRKLDSLLIARHGQIVLDAYYAPYAADIPHKINSSTKAVIGTLTAVALKDGLLDSTDHRLLDFFGDRSLAKVDDRKNAITLQNILDMTSGINWTEPLTARPDSAIAMERSPDWIKFILDRSIVTAPGEVFNYNSGNPHLMSAILTKLTGMSASDYAKAKLFGPLGITTWDWPHDPQGVSIGGYGLAMLPRDMAKIGYLYLRNGEWEGKPLLPPSWIYQVSHATVNMNQEFLDIIFSLHPSSILHQINLSARRLAWPPRPTMIRSCTTMPSGPAMSMMALVICTSACDGAGSPEGWLCSKPPCKLSL